MKLTDLRPCDNCGGPVGHVFNVIRTTTAVVDAQAVREYAGLSLMMGSGVLAEAMGAHQSNPVKLMAEQPDSGGWTDIFLCTDCYCAGEINPAMLSEKVSESE